jgi:filamentous hemagglutinin family protein
MNQFRGSWRWQLLVSAVIVGGVAASGNCALAQSKIVPDGTLGNESSVVVRNFRGLSVEAIDGGAQRGQNLFHSFQEFNVSEGRGAYFYSPDAGIVNILARVTGGNPSEILGVLGTFGNSQPNLFLINPNGIIFGRNARLNVGGSFFASTANSVVFDNGYQFSATNPQAPPLLTINVPLGLQFGANPGRIVNQSVVGLAVQPGRTLALVGGEVALEGGILFTSDGRIELGSVAGNSQVNLTPNSTGYTLGYEGVENFQDIRLTQGAIVLTNTNVGGGSIQVQGRNVTLTDGSVISTATSGAGKGGNLIINASDSVQVIGTSADGLPSSLFARANSTATGEAGDIKITTPTLLVQDGAFVTTSTRGRKLAYHY